MEPPCAVRRPSPLCPEPRACLLARCTWSARICRSCSRSRHADVRAILDELWRDLKGDGAASAVAGDDVRAVQPEGADLRYEVRGEFHDSRKRFAMAIDTCPKNG